MTGGLEGRLLLFIDDEIAIGDPCAFVWRIRKEASANLTSVACR